MPAPRPVERLVLPPDPPAGRGTALTESELDRAVVALLSCDRGETLEAIGYRLGVPESTARASLLRLLASKRARVERGGVFGRALYWRR
jgi:hypothetical protein